MRKSATAPFFTSFILIDRPIAVDTPIRGSINAQAERGMSSD
jgi:hypothetical protein